MVYKSPEEALADDQAILGPEFGLAFYNACQEFWRISSAWDRYEALYSTEKRVELLNRTGSNFWGILQGVLFEHVLLGLCRLTDPASNRHQNNLSIRYLLELEPSKHKRRLEQAIDRARKKSEFARHWRDKRIAHNDLQLITGQAGRLALATRNRVCNALMSIHHVLRWINARHFGGDLFLIDMGDTDALEVMGILADGLYLKDIRRADFLSGGTPNLQKRDCSWMGDAPDPTKRYDRQDLYALPKQLKP